MNERINRVLAKMEEKGLTQLLVSDPLSIRFLTGIMVNPGERLYALLLRSNGKHTLFLNYLYYVSDTGFEEVWFSDMDDQIGVLMEHIDTESVLGIDKTWPARFLIPLQERCPQMKTIWGSDCVDGVRAVKNEEEIQIMKEASVINDKVMEKVADFIKEGMTEKEAEAVIKPGVRFCDIDAQARNLIDEAGYSEYWKIRLGHFIGQEDHEYGDVSPINKNVAEPGMIFSIEPGIYIEGKYGVRIEDLVLVTEDGHELLNAVDKKWRIVG